MTTTPVQQARKILVRNARHPNHHDLLLAYARQQATPAVRRALFKLLFEQ
ncbi:hypothetical protein LCL99_10900 [Halomonas denitrificans]|nr:MULTISPECIES: hypothetical protein [Halomonas]MED5294964.1 hypothetical protein [Pseudomonadota bacterium]MBN8413189.1 hypothetical protein [Halomonas litopenaei]MBY5924238.1 hypothetical protein [Halomonas sp. DP4Y7-2]MBY5928407.1 hypothetical protein [Halomonas sp. DP8Y7-3]MBY5967060.1 hypothetical protein [Halomonas denitrificans]